MKARGLVGLNTQESGMRAIELAQSHLSTQAQGRRPEIQRNSVARAHVTSLRRMGGAELTISLADVPKSATHSTKSNSSVKSSLHLALICQIAALSMYADFEEEVSENS